MRESFFRPRSRNERRRRITELFLIAALAAGVSVLTYHVIGLPRDETGAPVSGSVPFLILVDVNVILVLILLFLVLRNVTKLIFERRRGALGSRFRTKLTVAFVSLSLLPTLVLFITATTLITRTFDARFSASVEEALEQSLEVARFHYVREKERLMGVAERIAAVLVERRVQLGSPARLEAFLEEARATHDLPAVAVYGRDLQLVGMAARSDFYQSGLGAFPQGREEDLTTALEGRTVGASEPIEEGLLIRGIAPIRAIRGGAETLLGAVVADAVVPRALAESMAAVAGRQRDYRQLKYYGPQIQAPYKITLLLITLMIVFAATWFGIRVSKGITDPVKELAEATKSIAQGNYDVHVDWDGKDEMSMLVRSFNSMASDLKVSKRQLESAVRDLEASAQEIEERRAYMEIVLRNVAAGVVSLDRSGHVSTMNNSAARLFGIDPARAIGRHYRDLVGAEQLALIHEALASFEAARTDSLERELRVDAGGETHTILVIMNRLTDDEGKDLGMVIVFDDLTELIKAQRASAWREVARRIAHEIKNPLTPIQLSAQRLRRKYGAKLGEDRVIFDECIDTIVRQVQDLKYLVNEFSNFARMPATKPTPNDLNRVIREASLLFAQGHKAIRFHFDLDPKIPIFDLDAEQIKRVVTNILDNAMDAMEGRGNVTITTRFNGFLQIARIEIGNDGKPVPPEQMGRLFEPYFSTKSGGSGLGLAIVKTIISDHNGYIRVRSAQPRGTTFTIELPVKA